MGFYGNINNTTKVQFSFDRIFSSRKAMDEEAQAGSDGVFAGRFVLVSYDKEVHNFPIYFLKNGVLYNNLTDATNGTNQVTLPENTLVHIPLDHNLDEANFIGYFKVNGTGGLDLVTNENNENPYLLNYLDDISAYGSGRGYDGTVWQKVYTDEGGQFAMAAELNSIVPTLAITTDAPTIVPKAPHFDVDSSNVYYKLHIQPTPGLWIRPAKSSSKWSLSEVDYPSDVTYTYPLVNNSGNIEPAVDKAAIYFNKAGFEKDKITYSDDDLEDNIKLELLTGQSGQKYGVDGSINKTEQPDINELVIMLPSIGDTMAQVWDLVYGGKEVAVLENMRRTDIKWEDAGKTQARQGLRLTKNEKFGGIGYAQDEVNTVAGSINTMHDLIGMIIVDASQDNLEDEQVIQTKDSDKIYWKNEQYYRIGIEYDPQYDENDATKNTNPLPHFEETQLNQPKANIYFDKYGDNYLLVRDVSDFKKNKKYYEWTNLSSAFSPANVTGEKAYQKGMYYYKQGNDYILEMSDTPVPEHYPYLEIAASDWQEAANGRNIIWYAENRFYRQQWDTSVTPKVPTGLMERDTPSNWNPNPNNNNHYQLYLADIGYKEDGTTTSDIIYKNVTNRVLIFEPNTYYIKDDVNHAYRLITEDAYRNIWSDDTNDDGTEGTAGEHLITDIPDNLSVYAYTLAKQDTPVTVYVPGTYYYLEDWVVTDDSNHSLEITDQGNQKRVIGDILKDTSKDITQDRTYFIKNENPSITQNSFYIMNEYYLRDDNNGTVEGDETPASHKYTLSTAAYTSATYYEKFDKHVISDDNNIFPTYYKWNPNIPVPYSIDEQTDEFTGVQLCWLKDRQVLKELEGYARDKNTLNGLLLETHKKFGAENTRDIETVNGAINTLQDLTYNFATMEAGKSVIVDAYGRMHTATINNLNNAPNRVGGGDDWINLSINPNIDNPTITIEHLKKDVIDTTAAAATNLSTSTSASVSLQDLTFDAMGHVNANKAHTYNLPYNFGNITVGANTISPDNTFDTLTLIGDNWLQLTADANNDSITFTHNTPQTAATITLNEVAANNVTPAFGSTFNIDDWTFDANGHMAGGTKHTVTIPQGSYTNTPTNEGVGVITGLGFTPSTGAITSTSNYLGAIQLGSYTAPSGGNGISTTSTLSDALATLDARIVAEETARGNAISGLTVSDPSVLNNTTATQFISAISQTNGVINATKANLPVANITNDVAGIVSLSNAIDQDDATKAATSKAVKAVYDLATQAVATWDSIKGFEVGKDINNNPITLETLTSYLVDLYRTQLTPPKSLTGITVTPPTKLTYTENDALDLTDMVVTAHYSGGWPNETLAPGAYTTSPVNGATLATTDVSVIVTCGTFTDSFAITVNAAQDPENPGEGE